MLASVARAQKTTPKTREGREGPLKEGLAAAQLQGKTVGLDSIVTQDAASGRFSLINREEK